MIDVQQLHLGQVHFRKNHGHGVKALRALRLRWSDPLFGQGKGEGLRGLE